MINNGLLALSLTPEQIAALVSAISNANQNQITVDVEHCRLTSDSAKFDIPLTISERFRNSVMLGVDAVGETLTRKQDIKDFETKYFSNYPWLNDPRPQMARGD